MTTTVLAQCIARFLADEDPTPLLKGCEGDSDFAAWEKKFIRGFLFFFTDKTFRKCLMRPKPHCLLELHGFTVRRWVGLLYRTFTLDIVLHITDYGSEQDLLNDFRHECMDALDIDDDFEGMIAAVCGFECFDLFMEGVGLYPEIAYLCENDEEGSDNDDEGARWFMDRSCEVWVEHLSQMLSENFIREWLFREDDKDRAATDLLHQHGALSGLGIELMNMKSGLEEAKRFKGRDRMWWADRLREFADSIHEFVDSDEAHPPPRKRARAGERQQVCLCTSEMKTDPQSQCVCFDW